MPPPRTVAVRLSPWLLGAGVLLVWVAAGAASPAAADSGAPPAAFAAAREAFVEEMVAEHGFERARLTELLAGARYRQSIIDAMERPYEGRPWRIYRRLFVTPERIDGGVRFMAENAALLDAAEAVYGVPAALLTAIIGIETNYGRNLGAYRALDALATLGFAYPRRADFFRDELEALLLLAREEDIDAAAVEGSYAGALGVAQFIPSSYRAYAVDFDQDGRRDLWRSKADIIGSVAAYLAEHGWIPGGAVAARAVLGAPLPDDLAVGGRDPRPPRIPVRQLTEAGVVPRRSLEPQARAALLRLEGEAPEYWVVLENFYVVTRYNHSNLYALAAVELSREIAARRTEDRRGDRDDR